ncbi:amidase [Microbacterium sp. PMB16]|uniref:amidase n=1 Tax=Microbacterium sp. PMB16 TaxID=3120157 RepID=UPI003F4BA10A
MSTSYATVAKIEVSLPTIDRHPFREGHPVNHSSANWLDAHEMARLIRSRELSPTEAVESVLRQLENVEPSINAFVTIRADEARAEAKRAEQVLSSTVTADLPPLFGVPISIKDLADTAGIRTTYGSTAFRDHVPATDSLPVHRIRESGAIIIGKTTTPEWGALGVTESALTGITNNPWDTDFAAGGSSGGAAASVAAGVGGAAWGSDGGGSVRVPASMCGIVGLKPSLGRIPSPIPWESASTDGPLARSVADVALLLDITAGPDRRDPLSLPRPSERFYEVVIGAGDLAGKRIAYAPAPGDARVEQEVARIVAAAVARFSEAGATVDTVALPVPDPITHFLNFWGPGFDSSAGPLPHPAMQRVVDAAGSAEDFVLAATRTRAEITEAFAQVFDNFDLIVTPTLPVVPFRHAGAAGGATSIDGYPVDFPAIDFHRFTESPSHAGLPAITVPVGFSDNGLPVGMQIIGDHLDDLGVLVAAAVFEGLAPWKSVRPALAG